MADRSIGPQIPNSWKKKTTSKATSKPPTDPVVRHQRIKLVDKSLIDNLTGQLINRYEEKEVIGITKTGKRVCLGYEQKSGSLKGSDFFGQYNNLATKQSSSIKIVTSDQKSPEISKDFGFDPYVCTTPFMNTK
jgi:hypothetical protein